MYEYEWPEDALVLDVTLLRNVADITEHPYHHLDLAPTQVHIMRFGQACAYIYVGRMENHLLSSKRWLACPFHGCSDSVCQTRGFVYVLRWARPVWPQGPQGLIANELRQL